MLMFVKPTATRPMQVGCDSTNGPRHLRCANDAHAQGWGSCLGWAVPPQEAQHARQLLGVQRAVGQLLAQRHRCAARAAMPAGPWGGRLAWRSSAGGPG